MSPTQRSLAELRKTCEHCGTLFRPKRKTHRTCSRKCGVYIRGGLRKRAEVFTDCQTCKAHFKTTNHRLQTRAHQFCSHPCYWEWKTTNQIGVKNPNYKDAGKRLCEGCGKPYRSYDKDRRFCGVACSQRLASSWGMAHVRRGTEAEYMCLEILARQGYQVMRSKASRGTFDLWAVGCGEVLFVQVKRTRNYSRRFSPKFIREVTGSLCYAKTPKVRKQLWSFVDEGPRMGWYILDL